MNLHYLLHTQKFGSRSLLMNSVQNKGGSYLKLLSNPYFDSRRISQAKDLTALHALIPNLKNIVTTKKIIKCYCISDLHADTTKNQKWVEDNCCRTHSSGGDDGDDDVYSIIILPGDVGSEVDRIEVVFKHLVQNYDAVCYVSGNHEAWKRGIIAVRRSCSLHSLS